MDAESYMNDIVDPTISDFEANPASRRHAFLACVATYHCIDYLTHPARPRNIVKEFRENPDFAVVDRIAHAFKHVKAGHSESPDNQPLRVEAVSERPPASWGRAVWDVSRWDDPVGGVEIANEGRDDILNIVKRAAAFLRTKLQG